MEVKDLLLTPFYLVVIYIIAYRVRNKYYANNILKKYFIPGLTLKIIGAVALGLIYQFYYSGGDTYNYFNYGSKKIWNAFGDDPSAALSLIFGKAGDHSLDNGVYSYAIMFFNDPPSYFVVRVSAFFGLFCFHTYTIIAIFFAVFGFAGLWLIFQVFCVNFPQLHKKFAIGILYLPSIILWGSGLLKDSLTLGALGILFYAFYQLFINKKRSIKNIVLLSLSFWLISSIKIYIALCFVPCLIFWLFLNFSAKIKDKTLRMLSRPFLLMIGAVFVLLSTFFIEEEDSKYSVDNITHTVQETAGWIRSQGNSAYKLSSNFDGTPGSFITLAPEAINVTLFRPYLWEVSNPLMLFSALESFVFLLLTLQMIFFLITQRPKRLIAPPNMVVFALAFSLFFAIAIGLSTGNFGTLSRYKIPALPFYIASVVILSNKSREY